MSYAVSGNAAAAAKETGIPHRTVLHWVTQMLNGKDEHGAALVAEFGAALRVRVMDSAQRMATGVIEVASDRFHKKLPKGAQMDSRPQYGKLVMDGVKVFAALRRTDLEQADQVQAEGASVVIHVTPDPPETTPDPDTPCKSPTS